MIVERLDTSGIYREFPNLNIEIRKGFLDKTLPGFPDRPIAFLHIDVDLYAGYRDALTYLFPKVRPGGIIAFDEYREFPKTPEYGNGMIEKWPGCTKSVDDYFADSGQEARYYPETKKYYIVKG